MVLLSRACTALAVSLMPAIGEFVNLAEAPHNSLLQDEAVQLLQRHVEKVHHSLLQEPLQTLSQEMQEALKRLPQTSAGKDLICASVDASKVDATKEQHAGEHPYAARIASGQCDTPAGMWNDESTGKIRLAKYKSMVKFLGLDSSHSVIDWGTGCGTEIAEVAAKTGIRATGIDLEDGLIQWAKTNLHIPNAQFCLTDGATFPFESASADAIISNGVLFHVGDLEDEQKSVQEMLRVLRPGGCGWMAYLGDKNHDPVGPQDWNSATIPGAIHQAVWEKDIFEATEYNVDSYSLIFCKQ